MTLERADVYLEHDLLEEIKMQGSVSKYIRRLVHEDINSTARQEERINQLRKKLYKLEVETFDTRKQLEYEEQRLELLKEKELQRPVWYHDVVILLTEDLDEVTEHHIVLQARKYDVSVETLKNWLWNDGYYDKIFRRN